MTETVNVHEAKTNFSRLLERAKSGETIIIAKAGKPVAQLSAIPRPQATEEQAKRRIGFMDGQIQVPDDFDTMFADEIERMFNGESDV